MMCMEDKESLETAPNTAPAPSGTGPWECCGPAYDEVDGGKAWRVCGGCGARVRIPARPTPQLATPWMVELMPQNIGRGR